MTSGNLNVVDAGTGPALVLLHAAGLDHSFWGEVPERCLRLHRVVSLDLPGHGSSPPASDPGRMQDFVSSVEQTLCNLELRGTTVLGLSFGGMIAQELALRRPDLVKRLILCACGPRIPLEARESVRDRGRIALSAGIESIIEPTLQRWFTTGFLDSPEVSRVASRLRRNSPADWTRTWHAIAEHDALQRLGALDIPTLVVIGDEDRGTTVEMATALAGAIVNADLVVLKGAPHMLQLEGASRFADLVAKFLGPGTMPGR